MNWILNMIAERVKDRMWEDLNDIKTQNLNTASDITNLLLDIKNDKMSIQTRSFLCRMNISPDRFTPQVKKGKK